MRIFLACIYLVLTCLSFSLLAEPELRRQLIQQNPEQFLEAALQRPEQHSSLHWLEVSYAYLQLNQKESALDSIEKAIQLARLLDDKPMYQTQLYRTKAEIVGRLYRNTQLGIEALLTAENWLDKLPQNESQLERAEVYESLAQAFNQDGDYAQAVQYAHKSLELAQHPAQKLNAHYLLGRLHLQMDKINDAFSHFSHAKRLATELKAEHAFPLIDMRFGLGYQKMGLYELALHHFTLAKDGLDYTSQQRAYVNVLLKIANIELQQNLTNENTYDSIQQALILGHQVDDVYSIAEATFYLGQWHLSQQNMAAAAYHFEQSHSMFSQINSHPMQSQVLLAMAELYHAQQQHELAQSIFARIHIDIDDSNQFLFLRYRYAELAAELASWQEDWVSAYDFSQQVLKLRFDDLREQHNLKLDYLQMTQPHQQSETTTLDATDSFADSPLQWLTLLSVVLTLGLAWALLKLRARPILPSQMIFSRQWIQFSDKLVAEQRHKKPLYLMAVTLRGCQYYKQQHGEIQLRRVLISLLHSLKLPQIVQLAIHSDVLWLGLRCEPNELASLQSKVLCQLAQQRVLLKPQPQLQTLILPLQELLGNGWQKQHIQALREAVWLSWYLAEQINPSDEHIYLQLKVLEPQPCEWMTENIRQDILNALQLGSIELWQQDQSLNPQLRELLETPVQGPEE
ncbi:tetratricopeptide repeat protein [Alkalimonas collagenimarina]|uniref:Tetratricopeptide repeat protein n=1 Tax=Alkalimonas collagenimarina TaxID=400390 RepID=A0ABT9GYH1_9GAMM|nr:tetratricopeptide repeat protein [Alkalimonas collagenimarina]MDP4536104.1 tetratricopeptide repeat protein [Alkalimonas collagenimarina]